jgi:hypothetical protein
MGMPHIAKRCMKPCPLTRMKYRKVSCLVGLLSWTPHDSQMNPQTNRESRVPSIKYAAIQVLGVFSLCEQIGSATDRHVTRSRSTGTFAQLTIGVFDSPLLFPDTPTMDTMTAKEQALVDEINLYDWDDIDAVIGLILPTIGFTFDLHAEPKTHSSRFGGVPVVPKEFQWPETNGEPLAFYFQMNMDELAEFDIKHKLPSRGILSCFLAVTNDAMYEYYDEPRPSVVYFHADPSELEPATLPSGLPDELLLPPVQTLFDISFELPSGNHPLLTGGGLSSDDFDGVHQVFEEVSEKGLRDRWKALRKIVKPGGSINPQAPNPPIPIYSIDHLLGGSQFECEEWAEAYYGDEADNGDEGLGDHFVNLVSVRMDSKLGTMLGEAEADVCLGISVEDLEAGNLEKALVMVNS